MSPKAFSNREVRPNFLIVGAAKSGTTSLHYWLSRHPEVFMPQIKEPAFFVKNYGIDDRASYLSLFRPGNGKKAVGEASTAYLTSPESPRWIKDSLGDIGIIIILRNPADRAFSLYSYMVMMGHEWLSTFSKALREENRRFCSKSFLVNCRQYFWNYMYFRSGLYYEQVARYFDVFGRESVKIFLFDDLVKSPDAVCSSICDFLGISSAFKPLSERLNPGRKPLTGAAIQSLLGYVPYKWSYSLPDPYNKILWNLGRGLMVLNVKMGFKPRALPEIRKELLEKYRNNIVELSGLIGQNLNLWLD